MLLAQDIRPLPRSPQQRFVSIAIVAGIHVAVIAGILISLNKTLLPSPHTEIVIDTVPPPKTKEALPPPPDPTLVRPRIDVPQPQIDVARDAPQTTVSVVDPPAGPPTNVDPAPRVFAAKAIAGTHTTPDYPPIDRRLGHEGNVLLKLTIDEWGAVVDAQVERSSGYETLDRAAASWVKTHWLYHPATRAGDPIRSTTEALVTFRLTTH